jgi:hypothetical protein
MIFTDWYRLLGEQGTGNGEQWGDGEMGRWGDGEIGR